MAKGLTLEELEEIGAIRALLQSGAAKAIRQRAVGTQLEIATAAGCHWTTVSKLEAGQRVPRSVLALRLAEIYKVLVDVALEGK